MRISEYFKCSFGQYFFIKSKKINKEAFRMQTMGSLDNRIPRAINNG